MDGQTPTYDAAGNLTTAGGTAYTYDAFGELIHVDAGASARRSYVRDALGRIILERNESTGANNALTRYAHDGARRHYRQRPDGTKERMIDGQELDEHLVLLGGTAYRYHQDRTGNVFLITDPAGTPVEWYRYTAYGDVTIQSPSGQPLTESAIGNRFGFQGHPFDTPIGLIDMRQRAYSPGLGRFLTRDPIGLAGGTNPYAFVDSSPLLYTDPFGLAKLAADRELRRCRDGLHCSLEVGKNHFFSNHQGRYLRNPAGQLTRFRSREAFTRVLESNVDMARIRGNPNLARTAFAPLVVPDAMKAFVAISVLGAAGLHVRALAVLLGASSGTDEGTALFGALGGLLGGRGVSAARRMPSAPVPAARATGARTLGPSEWDAAEAAYNVIRTTDDVGVIARNTNWPTHWVSRVKDHLFNRTHMLDDGIRRFDADPAIANAWHRLQAGTHGAADMQLLRHELFEARFEGLFRTIYRAAHDAANRSGRPSGL